MRFFWFLTFAGCLVVAVTLIGEVRLNSSAQEPAKQDEKKVDEKKSAGKIEKLDEDILRRANLTTDSKALVNFLKNRILPEKERPDIERLARRLGSADYRTREKATTDLIARGVAVIEVLRASSRVSADFEALRRIERSMQMIREKDVGPEVPAAAVRVASLQKTPGLMETLLAYLPFADNDAVLEELRVALLKHALHEGKADPLLVAALTDRAAIRRATAAEVLGRTAFADHKDAVRKLLADPDPLVRYRLARTLAFAQQRDAIPMLIDTIPDLPINTAWQAEDFLLKLATGAAAPTVAMGNDKDARDKCKAAWQAWWKKHGDKVDLTKLEDAPRLLGRTLIVLLDQNTVLELGPDNQPRFEIRGIVFPLDAQLIDDDRVLVAEYHANRVTERNSRGEMLWQKVGIVGPQVAQRLPNGNTFVATSSNLFEFDKDGKSVMDISLADAGQQKIMKATKLPNGEIACMLADARIVRFDSQGNELHSFPIPLGMRLFGGRIHMLANGRALIPHTSEGKVVEYDSKGKAVWETTFEQPIAATRLPNGNTLITSMNPLVGAVEVDRTGNEIWSYRHASNTRVTRAIRR